MTGEFARIALLLVYTVASVAGMAMIKDAPTLVSLKGLAGLGLYVAGFVIWIGVILRVMPMSQAFPLASGCLLLGTQLAGWLFLRERISPAQLAGVALILAGVVIVSLASPLKR